MWGWQLIIFLCLFLARYIEVIHWTDMKATQTYKKIWNQYFLLLLFKKSLFSEVKLETCDIHTRETEANAGAFKRQIFFFIFLELESKCFLCKYKVINFFLRSSSRGSKVFFSPVCFPSTWLLTFSQFVIFFNIERKFNLVFCL